MQNFWIGGFTDFDPGSTIPYSEYYSLESGNEYFIVLTLVDEVATLIFCCLSCNNYLVILQVRYS